MRGRELAVAALLAFGAGTASAETSLYVATTGTDVAACGDIAAPCKTVQFAVDKTTVDVNGVGDTVIVGSGTYNECVVIIPGTGVGGVKVLARSLVEANTAGLAILDGAGQCDLASGTPGPVALVNDLSVLSGFTIKNGGISGVRGLGAVTITNNVISGNTTPTVGGGIFLTTGSYLTDGDKKALIKFNTIRDNTSGSDGGGLYVDASADGIPSVIEIEGNAILTNTAGGVSAPYGGGITVFTDTVSATDVSAVAITTNVLDGNVAAVPAGSGGVSYGGGVFVATGGVNGLGTETILVGGAGVGNKIRNNVSEGIGGGISANLQPADGATHTITVMDNIVTANTGNLGGGGIHAFATARDLPTGTNALILEKNSIIGNHAGKPADPPDPSAVGGGGLYAETYGERTPDGVVAIDIRRNGIRANDTTSFGGGASLLVYANDDPVADGNTLPTAASLRFDNNLVAVNKAIDATGGAAVGGGVSLLARSIGAQASVTVEQRFLTVVGNQSDASAGGLEWDATSGPDSVSGGGTIAIELSNSILQGNDGYAVGGPIVPGGTISVSIGYNDAIDNVVGDYQGQLGASTGTNGNVSVDPALDLLYVPPLCSPSIDMGDPAIDASDEPLPNGGRVNLGHLGHTLDAPRTFPDVNGDGVVDGLDILGIAVSFNSDSATGDPRFFAAADRDLNGLVDGEDLAYVSAFYAQSCP